MSVFHGHSMSRLDGGFLSFDLYYDFGIRPTHAAAVDYLTELFSDRLDLTQAKIKYNADDRIIHIYNARIDGFGGFAK